MGIIVTHKASMKRPTQTIYRNLTVTHLCHYCDFKTSWKSSLKRHLRAIHQNISYPCDYCNFKTSWKASLKQHTESLHKKITYPCDRCNYKAKRRNDLKKHTHNRHKEIIHTGDQQQNKSNTMRHSKRHIDLIYFCNQCDYVTTWKKNLKQHKSLHRQIIAHYTEEGHRLSNTNVQCGINKSYHDYDQTTIKMEQLEKIEDENIKSEDIETKEDKYDDQNSWMTNEDKSCSQSRR